MKHQKVTLYPDRIVFDPPINPKNIGKLDIADKKRIVKFVSIITGIDHPEDERILDFLERLGLKNVEKD